MTKNEEIALMEHELKINLPNSYKKFLHARGKDIAFGYPVLGLPATYDFSTALGASAYLRTARPELTKYVAIRVFEDRMLCLDLSVAYEQDAPLAEVNLSSTERPAIVHHSFESYLRESDQSKQEINDALKRIRNLYSGKQIKDYNHTAKDNKIPFKARDWRLHRCCVHDLIVGITMFKYSELFNGIEVDVFLTTDHPEYEEGHGTKALMTLILSDAYRNGTSMEVRFTKQEHNTSKRISDKIPVNLLKTIENFGIKLIKQETGIITHEESINIFSSLLGIQDEAKMQIKRLEQRNEATLQGICFLINSRVWAIEQINWLILNAARAKAVIFGRDNPEDRLNYAESLSLGRCACALTKLKHKIEASSSAGSNEVDVHISGIFFILNSQNSFAVNWLSDGAYFEIEARMPLVVLSRPRSKWIQPAVQIAGDIGDTSNQEGPKILLYTNDILNHPDALSVMQSADTPADLNFMILPFSAEELDDEVITKMKKARTYRS